MLCEAGDTLLPLVLKGGDRRLSRAGVFIAFTGRGDLSLGGLPQPLHIVPQLSSSSRGEAEGLGPVGVGEVVYVAPVRGDLFAFGHLLQEAADGSGLACAWGTGLVYVKALVLDAEPEANRLGSPLLADEAGDRADFGGGGKGEAGRLGHAAQLFRGKLFDH